MPLPQHYFLLLILLLQHCFLLLIPLLQHILIALPVCSVTVYTCCPVPEEYYPHIKQGIYILSNVASGDSNFASRNAERRKTPVFERSDAQKHVESGEGVTCNPYSVFCAHIPRLKTRVLRDEELTSLDTFSPCIYSKKCTIYFN